MHFSLSSWSWLGEREVDDGRTNAVAREERVRRRMVSILLDSERRL